MIDTRFWVSLILGYWYHGIIDTRFWVSLMLGYWYQGIIDIRFGVSLILGSGYRWYLDTGIWVSLILGSGYRWYLDTGIWVSLILGLGICGYACNMWKLLLGDSPTKHLKRHSFFTGEAHMYPASLKFCSSSSKSLATKCQCFKATLK